MSWSRMRALIESESSPEVAQRVEARARLELQGCRVQVPRPETAARPTADQIRSALARHQWRVADAAAELGIDRATIYRLLQRDREQNARRLARVAEELAARDQGPRLNGRVVR